MTRWISPLLFFAAAAYVFQYNEGHTDSVLMLPFVDAIFPSLKGNPVAIGLRSVMLLVGIGGLLCLSPIIGLFRSQKSGDSA